MELYEVKFWIFENGFKKQKIENLKMENKKSHLKCKKIIIKKYNIKSEDIIAITYI